MTDLNRKSILARLLANENIVVEQTNHHTAFFDVKNRILGLPHWKDINKDLYDLLVGHEVGHALETPALGWHSCTETIPGCPRDYVNVVEDIRIEKLILRRYPGLLGSFMRGYQDLLDRDFFGLKKKEIEKMSFINRLNVHSKSRGLVKVPFKQVEQPYLDMAMAVETWEDVIVACRAIYEFVKEELEREREALKKAMANAKKEASGSSGGSSEGEEQKAEKKARPDVVVLTNKKAKKEEDGDSDPMTKEEMEDILDGVEKGEVRVEIDETPDEAGVDEEEDETPSDDKIMTGGDDGNIEEAETDRQFHQNFLRKLVDSASVGGGTLYVKAPSSRQIDAVITKYEEVRAARAQNLTHSTFPFEAYVAFQAEIKPVVANMVKEFEMRKAAYRTARARTSTKGSLDVNLLHKYRFEDNLFKQVTYLADGVSHGMVMLIDYSGSMEGVIRDVIKQLLVLVSFCKRVNIPFAVYGFTSPTGHMANKQKMINALASELTSVAMHDCHIFELITSSMKKAEYESAYRGLFHQTVSHAAMGMVEAMNGTPLGEALLAMLDVTDEFKRKNNVQKMTFVTLTDGDGGYLPTTNGIDHPNRSVRTKMVVGKDFKIKIEGYASPTKEILDVFRSRGIKTMNYYLVGNSSFGHLTDRALKKAVRADGYLIQDDVEGYDRKFTVRTSTLSTKVDDLQINDNATTNKIAKEFAKHASAKKNARLIAQKFAEIAS